MVRGAIVACVLSGPAVASDGCHDLWFARNATIDAAGYCFGSALGQAVFDNSDCVGKDVALSPEATALVDHIRARERQYGCKVNTRQTTLDIEDLDIRRLLTRQPVRDEFESACLEWQGNVVPLFASPSRDAAVTGVIEPGVNISYAYEPVGTWTYVTTTDAEWNTLSGGWHDTSAVEERCREIAG